MLSEDRRDEIINATECYLENHIEHLLKEKEVINKIDKKYRLDLDSEDKKFIKELFVAHLILNVF